MSHTPSTPGSRSAHTSTRFCATALLALLIGVASAAAGGPTPNPAPPFIPSTALTEAPASPLGPWVILSWNDLGMHCMNRNHLNLSVLPPYNNMTAQVIHRGNAASLPQLVTTGVTLNYSIPGNTESASKTDFWTYAPALFGLNLPLNIGLGGKGLTGTLDPVGTHFAAIGIPVTPYPDATPNVEDPYQLALIVATDGTGAELARSTPVIPVSTELSCISSGCHSSEAQILNNHPREQGFDPNARPILCARCHADPALGTTGNSEAYWFSFRIHDQHKFMDQQFSGTALCYKCHPGPNAQCLRGTMNTNHGMICQDCHGTMSVVSGSIEHFGRTPWLSEPACATCHTARFGEPTGQLFRNSTGHGGVMCAGCHGSPHNEFPSRQPRDNANMIALQGHAGTLSDCSVCHGVAPEGLGPHQLRASGVLDGEILAGVPRVRIAPNPTPGPCAVEVATRHAAGGTLMVFDAQGRAVRLLKLGEVAAESATARWDGQDGQGRRVPPGVYFVRWLDGNERAGGKILVVR